MLNKILMSGMIALLPCAALSAELPGYPFIHASGNGEVRVPPDIGQIDFEVSAVDPDPAVAVQVVTARVAEIRTLMEQLGIAADELEVRDIRKDIKKVIAVPPPVDVRAGVKIIVRDLSKWRAVVAPLLAMPNLDGFATAFDTTQRRKAETELLADAIKVARQKAEGIAAGFGRKLGLVGGVSTGELKNLSRAMDLSPSEYFARAGRQVEISREDLLMVNMIKLSQGVDVIFRIK